ncbi:MAG: cyclase family protein [Lachnospiraceae bacterium]|nr:cyclase family protein [Lachnospiraceae bacterium]
MMIPKVKKILDLSQPVYHNCPGWPTYIPTIVSYEARHVTHDFEAERIEMNVHTGTHTDAPYHFFKDGIKLEQLDPMRFQGRGVTFDLRGIGQMAIEAKHLEACGVGVQKGDIALLYTGWGQKRDMTKEYFYEWPFLTAEAAQWLVDRGVKCVCIDGMSVGGWPEGCGAPAHEVLLGNEVMVVEELYMDEELLEEPEWYVVALPIKLKGFSGAPTRVVAMKLE